MRNLNNKLADFHYLNHSLPAMSLVLLSLMNTCLVFVRIPAVGPEIRRDDPGALKVSLFLNCITVLYVPLI